MRVSKVVFALDKYAIRRCDEEYLVYENGEHIASFDTIGAAKEHIRYLVREGGI